MKLTRRDFYELPRAEALVALATHLATRLGQIEPEAFYGKSAADRLEAKTEEGMFLADALWAIVCMTVPCDCPECTGNKPH